MRSRLSALLLTAIAACSAGEEPVAELTAETPPIEAAEDMPLNMVGGEEAIEEIAEAVLGSMNPLENDLRGLEVAVRLKDEFRIGPSGVEFELRATGRDGAAKVDELFKLRETSGLESALLDAEARDGFHIKTFALEETDKPAIAAADTVLQVMKEETPGENQLTFQAIAHSCVEPGAAPEQYSLTIYVRSHPDVEFVTLNPELLADRNDPTLGDIMFRACEA
ncbi:MAG: hypothetical protein AAF768_10335 [Pseudomonadota bacterium]